MKYTNPTFRVAAILLATFVWVGQSPAQSAYISGAPTLSASNTGSGGPGNSNADSDDSQSAMITLHARVNEVNVLFIATDKHGKFVRDLNQTDFSILDDHKPPQAIVNFRREADLPLDLGLLIDSSGSVHGRFDFEQTAATSFLEQTIPRSCDTG